MVQIDMPLPKDCRTCRFRDPDYNYCYAEEDGRIACAAGRREDWCPLKETISGSQRIRLKKSTGIPCIVDLPFKDCSRCVKFSPRMIHDTLYADDVLVEHELTVTCTNADVCRNLMELKEKELSNHDQPGPDENTDQL